jgi:hypothetical protein
MGIRANIAQGLADRLASITSANGYSTDVQKIFSDEIPMGLRLDEYELPAILIINGDDKVKRKTPCIHGEWVFEVQLINTRVADSVMHQFVADVFKCLYANDPNSSRNDAFRSINENIWDIEVTNIDPDLNTIESNRFTLLTIIVRYRASLTTL